MRKWTSSVIEIKNVDLCLIKYLGGIRVESLVRRELATVLRYQTINSCFKINTFYSYYMELFGARRPSFATEHKKSEIKKHGMRRIRLDFLITIPEKR